MLSHLGVLSANGHFGACWVIRNVAMLSFCISSGSFHTFAALVSDGAHSVIDRSRVRCVHRCFRFPFRECILDDVEMVHILSFTLFDQSFVAQYMIDNRFINVYDASFAEFGLEYLRLPVCTGARIRTRTSSSSSAAFVSWLSAFVFIFAQVDERTTLLDFGPGGSMTVRFDISAGGVALNERELSSARLAGSHTTLGAPASVGSTFDFTDSGMRSSSSGARH
jgi:hypothetical protein